MSNDPLECWVREQSYASPLVDRQSASIVQLDTGKNSLIVALCAAFCGLAVALAIWSASTAHDAATESRMVQYYLLDPHYRTKEEMESWAKFRRDHEMEPKEK